MKNDPSSLSKVIVDGNKKPRADYSITRGLSLSLIKQQATGMLLSDYAHGRKAFWISFSLSVIIGIIAI